MPVPSVFLEGSQPWNGPVPPGPQYTDPERCAAPSTGSPGSLFALDRAPAMTYIIMIHPPSGSRGPAWPSARPLSLRVPAVRTAPAALLSPAVACPSRRTGPHPPARPDYGSLARPPAPLPARSCCPSGLAARLPPAVACPPRRTGLHPPARPDNAHTQQRSSHSCPTKHPVTARWLSPAPPARTSGVSPRLPPASPPRRSALHTGQALYRLSDSVQAPVSLQPSATCTDFAKLAMTSPAAALAASLPAVPAPPSWPHTASGPPSVHAKRRPGSPTRYPCTLLGSRSRSAPPSSMHCAPSHPGLTVLLPTCPPSRLQISAGRPVT